MDRRLTLSTGTLFSKTTRSHFPDYDECNERENYVVDNHLTENFQMKIAEGIPQLTDILESKLKKYQSHSDCSMYSGMCGIAMLYFKLGTRLDDLELVERALAIVKVCLPGQASAIFDENCPRISILSGNMGPIGLAMVINHLLNRKHEAQSLMDSIYFHYPKLIVTGNNISDDVFTGRSGFVLMIMFVNSYLAERGFPEYTLQTVLTSIINSGLTMSSKERSCVPLMYKHTGKVYTGACLGLAGVLQTLLKAEKHITDSEFKTRIQSSVNFLLSQETADGRFPLVIGETPQFNLEWRVGYPGLTLMILDAYCVFADEEYLRTAIRYGELLWKTSGTTNGLSIATGASGIAYVFLRLYQITHDPKYLYRAGRFAEWTLNTCLEKMTTHDQYCSLKDLSLFEGLAGVIHYLDDMLHPSAAKMPFM